MGGGAARGGPAGARGTHGRGLERRVGGLRLAHGPLDQRRSQRQDLAPEAQAEERMTTGVMIIVVFIPLHNFPTFVW